MAAAAGLPLCGRDVAGLWCARNFAAQRIHLLQVLMNPALKNLLRLLCASAVIILSAAALNFIVDPLQLIRPARLFAAGDLLDNRMQNAGLIQSQQYDTVFMGTSLAIHYRQSDIDRILGVRSLKLSMTGSNSVEQSFVLAAALQHRPQRVIWQMDDWIFRDAPDIDADIYMPADLYRRNVKGISEYLFSGNMARESLWMLARSIPALQPITARLTNGVMFKFSISNVDDINVLRPDFDVADFYNANKAIAAFRRITDPVRNAYLAQDYDYDAMVRHFERDAIPLIEKHPDVTFDIYFTPYSILQFVAMRDASPATLQTVYAFTAYAAKRLSGFANVRLFDFRAVQEVTHDLTNYSDVIHHSPAVDLKILSWLAEGRYLVRGDVPTASLEQLKAQVEAYRTGELGR